MFGTKWLLLSSMFMNSLTSVLIPVTAEYVGANGVMVLRLIQGLFQGFLLPCMHAMLGRWIPPGEISVVNTLVYAGCTAGAILSMLITGYLSASWWGWPASFYLFGILGFTWCIFSIVLSAESPATHKTISMTERKFIEESLSQEDDHLIDKKSIPWKAIFTSMPYWAIVVAAIGESWGTTFLSSELPSYFSYAVGLNIEDSSLFSSVPTVGCLIAGLGYAPIAAYTISKGYTSTVNSRRIFHGFASFSLAAGLVLIPYIEDKVTVAVLLTVSMSASSGVVLGHLVNHNDISPRYAGALIGISNGTGQLVAIFAPILVHFVVTDETDKTLWKSMFIVAAAISAGTAVFFIIFCSGEKQWWDDVDKNKLWREKSTDLPNEKHGETNYNIDQ